MRERVVLKTRKIQLVQINRIIESMIPSKKLASLSAENLKNAKIELRYAAELLSFMAGTASMSNHPPALKTGFTVMHLRNLQQVSSHVNGTR